MNIETLELGLLGANCYVVHSGTPEALVIDPGGDPDVIAEIVKRKKLSIVAYILTHGHMDHICALADVYDMASAPIAMHADDLAWAFTKANTLPPYYMVPPRRPSKIDRKVMDGQVFTDGGLTYRVIHTPGHSPGCICLYFETENVLFTGDTLFAGSVGRTDLPRGSSAVLALSLARLAELPDKTVVYPGHGPQTTIGHEKRTNPYMAR